MSCISLQGIFKLQFWDSIKRNQIYISVYIFYALQLLVLKVIILKTKLKE